MADFLTNTFNQCGSVVDDCVKTVLDVPEKGLSGIGTNVGNLAKDCIGMCPAVIKDVTGLGDSSGSPDNTTNGTTGSTTGSTGGTTTSTTKVYNETTANQQDVKKEIVVDPSTKNTSTTTTTTYYTTEN